MNKPYITFKVSFALLILLFSCKKSETSDVKIDETKAKLKNTQMKKNSGWSTYAMDSKFFSNQKGRSFAYQYEYLVGDVHNDIPTFLAYSNIYALGSRDATPRYVKWHVTDEGTVKEVKNIVLGFYKNSKNSSERTGSLPSNLKKYDPKSSFTSEDGIFKFYNHKPYTSKKYIKKLFNTWRSTAYNSVDGQGFLSNIPSSYFKNKYPNFYSIDYKHSFSSYFEATKINNKKIAVGTTWLEIKEKEDGKLENYVAILGKDLGNSSTDTVEYISSLFKVPEKPALGATFSFLNGIGLVLLPNKNVIIGNFQNGFKKIMTLTNESTQEPQVINGSNSFFIIYGNKSYKVSLDGTVTNLANMPEKILSVVGYKGDLIVGHEVENQTIKVSKVTSGGLIPFGKNDGVLTKPLLLKDGKSNAGRLKIIFATDQKNLFAAIKNNQANYAPWTGWEIIKFNN